MTHKDLPAKLRNIEGIEFTTPGVTRVVKLPESDWEAFDQKLLPYMGKDQEKSA